MKAANSPFERKKVENKSQRRKILIFIENQKRKRKALDCLSVMIISNTLRYEHIIERHKKTKRRISYLHLSKRSPIFPSIAKHSPRSFAKNFYVDHEHQPLPYFLHKIKKQTNISISPFFLVFVLSFFWLEIFAV